MNIELIIKLDLLERASREGYAWASCLMVKNKPETMKTLSGYYENISYEYAICTAIMQTIMQIKKPVSISVYAEGVNQEIFMQNMKPFERELKVHNINFEDAKEEPYLELEIAKVQEAFVEEQDCEIIEFPDFYEIVCAI